MIQSCTNNSERCDQNMVMKGNLLLFTLQYSSSFIPSEWLYDIKAGNFRNLESYLQNHFVLTRILPQHILNR